MFVVNREFSVPVLAWSWLRYKQIPELFASLRKQPGCIPSDLLLAQLRGCCIRADGLFCFSQVLAGS